MRLGEGRVGGWGWVEWEVGGGKSGRLGEGRVGGWGREEWEVGGGKHGREGTGILESRQSKISPNKYSVQTVGSSRSSPQKDCES